MKKEKKKNHQIFLKFFKPEADKKIELKKMFDIFWKEHPKKVGKGYARKCFKRALCKVTFQKMMFSLKKQINSVEWKDKQFIPNPSTWMNQERWDDELTYKETISEKHKRLKAKGEI